MSTVVKKEKNVIEIIEIAIQGPVGATGPQGPAGPEQDVEAVLDSEVVLRYAGVWEPGAYEAGDVVWFNNDLVLCAIDTSIAPDDDDLDEQDWVKFSFLTAEQYNTQVAAAQAYTDGAYAEADLKLPLAGGEIVSDLSEPLKISTTTEERFTFDNQGRLSFRNNVGDIIGSIGNLYEERISISGPGVVQIGAHEFMGAALNMGLGAGGMSIYTSDTDSGAEYSLEHNVVTGDHARLKVDDYPNSAFVVVEANNDGAKMKVTGLDSITHTLELKVSDGLLYLDDVRVPTMTEIDILTAAIADLQDQIDNL